MAYENYGSSNLTFLNYRRKFWSFNLVLKNDFSKPTTSVEAWVCLYFYLCISCMNFIFDIENSLFSFIYFQLCSLKVEAYFDFRTFICMIYIVIYAQHALKYVYRLHDFVNKVCLQFAISKILNKKFESIFGISSLFGYRI